MSAHTPGPWRVEVREKADYCSHAHVWGPRVSIESSANPLPLADMRLIAAAPELLAAVQMLAEDLEDGHWSSTRAALRALIAKATQP